MLDGTNVIHVAVEHPVRPLRFDASVGDRAVPYATGLGKVLLAGLPVAEVRRPPPAVPWPRPRPTTITNPQQLEPVIAGVRRQGYAYDDEEWDEGLRCLAVPVAANGTTLAALSISGAAGEFSDDVRPTFLTSCCRHRRLARARPTIVAALTSAPAPRG